MEQERTKLEKPEISKQIDRQADIRSEKRGKTFHLRAKSKNWIDRYMKQRKGQI